MYKDISILIIDDDVERFKDTALIWKLEEYFNKVHFFDAPNKAIKFLSQNQTEHLIILLDIQFPKNINNGHRILEEIRKISFNIPVILWSGINEDTETFSDFINNGVIAYIKKDATSEEMIKEITTVADGLKSNIASSIEEWIEIHPKSEKNKPVYITADGKSYSLDDILKEIQMQTKVGKEFSKRLTKLTIDLLMRNKESLND